MDQQEDDPADHFFLERLTGVRSSKHTFYPEFRRKAQGLNRAIAALEHISATLTMTTAGPEVMANSVVDVAAHHFGGRWAGMALRQEAFRHDVPSLVARFSDHALVTDWDDLPRDARAVLTRVLEGTCPATLGGRDRGVYGGGCVIRDSETIGTQMYLGNAIAGALVVESSGLREIAEEDVAVLSTLGNQAAVALQSACLYQESERLRMKAAAALEMSEFHSKELELRNRQLQRAQDRLLQARQNRILDRERKRISRDLHDSVAQHLAAISMHLEWCMQTGITPPPIRDRIATCRKLARQGGTHIRQSIFELSSPDEDRFGLRVSLQDLAQDFMRTAQLVVSLRFVGRAVPLPAQTEHALFQVAQEAMFNVVKHSLASRATMELRYEAKFVGLVIADNGFGDPRALRKHLERPGDRPGRHHRGLRNIADRVEELKGDLVIRRRRGGGVSLIVRVPVTGPELTSGNGSDA